MWNLMFENKTKELTVQFKNYDASSLLQFYDNDMFFYGRANRLVSLYCIFNIELADPWSALAFSFLMLLLRLLLHDRFLSERRVCAVPVVISTDVCREIALCTAVYDCSTAWFYAAMLNLIFENERKELTIPIKTLWSFVISLTKRSNRNTV